ncbi:MAG: hypothetical protein ACTSYB_12560 [Candidatus Helarchaeota archaeon]
MDLIVFLSIGILFSIFAVILTIQHRRALQFYKQLSDLRQNSVNYYRNIIKHRTMAQLQVSKELDDVIRKVRAFIIRYRELRDKIREQEPIQTALTNLRAINEDFAIEISKLLEENQALKEELTQLKHENKQIDSLMVENFKLRTRNQELEARNQDLEYAINLESISMIESYQERDKLFSAIDDVRRSLTRILNPV